MGPRQALVRAMVLVATVPAAIALISSIFGIYMGYVVNGSAPSQVRVFWLSAAWLTAAFLLERWLSPIAKRADDKRQRTA